MPRKPKGTTQNELNEHGATAVAEPPVKAKKPPRKSRAANTQPSPVEAATFEPNAAAEPTPVVVAPLSAEAAPFDTVPVPAAPAPVEMEVAPAVASPVESPTAAAPAELQPSPPSSMPDEEPTRPRFRSWTIRSQSGYEKLTDTKRGLLVLKFQDRPSEDILNTLKDAGFRYTPDYEGHANAWLHRNDFEGRVQVDKIEAALRQQEQGPGAVR